MTNQSINGKQIQSILMMFWLGSVLVLGSSEQAKQDFWISILIATVMILPMIALYVRLIKLYPGMDLYDIHSAVFGKVFGNIISVLYILFAVYLGSTLLRDFSIFIRLVSLPETPQSACSVMILLVVIFSVCNGAENIGRVAKFTWKFFVVFVIFTFIVGMKDMEISHLLPIMNTDLKGILSASVSFFLLPLTEIVLCLSLFSSVQQSVNPARIFIKALSITVAMFLIVALRNVMILGGESSQIFFFTSFSAVSIISIGEFFSRFEILIGMTILLSGFTKLSVCLYTASLGVTKVFHIKTRDAVVPCALIFITFSLNMSHTAQELFQALPYFLIYALPCEVIFPIITLIGAEIRNRLKKSGSPGKDQQQDSPKQENTENA